jgi:hypothetical protein
MIDQKEIKPLLDDGSPVEYLLRDRRVALIYNQNSNNLYLGAGDYIKKALERLCPVIVFNPSEVNDIPQDFYLYIVVDDSSHYIFPTHLRPAACWLIDTHLSLSYDWIMALNFDTIFCAQRKAVYQLKKLGFENVHWLPLACDPEVHKGDFQSKVYDISFIGKLGFGKRKKTLLALKKLFPNSFISMASSQEMSKIYAQSKLVFNVSLRHDLNMRIFEGMCSGTALLADRVDGLDELFEEEKHYFSYNAGNEIQSRVRSLLSESKRLQDLGQTASVLVRDSHTYDNRVRAMLKKLLSVSKPASYSPILKLLKKNPFIQYFLLNEFVNILLLSWIDWGAARIRVMNKVITLSSFKS